MEKTMDKIIALAKARGFVYPGSEIYGGLANTWDYGNLGVELKNNVKKLLTMAKGYSIIFEENKEGRCIRLTSSSGKEVNSESKRAVVGSLVCCADAVCIRVFYFWIGGASVLAT